MRVSDVPVCRIMGVDIAAVDMAFVLDYLSRNLGSLRGNYICVSNVHTTVTSYKDAEYRSVQNGAAMALPDGRPLSLVGQRRGFRGMGRVAGPDLMGRVFADPRFARARHYFYGSTEETLGKLGAELRGSYEGIRIAGMWSPPFRALSDDEKARDIERINAADPDFVWVGLGAPKQERWMAEHEGKVGGLMVGVGAGFDYHAGNIRRAPRWMQSCGLEWLYRLMQDPRRLAGRYLSTNASFVYHAVLRGE